MHSNDFKIQIDLMAEAIGLKDSIAMNSGIITTATIGYTYVEPSYEGGHLAMNATIEIDDIDLPELSGEVETRMVAWLESQEEKLEELAWEHFKDECEQAEIARGEYEQDRREDERYELMFS